MTTYERIGLALLCFYAGKGIYAYHFGNRR